MKRLLSLILILLPYTFSFPTYASSPTLEFFVYSADQTQVYALAYAHPYTNDSQPVGNSLGVYDPTRNKSIVKFISLPTGTYDTFFYTSADGTYDPLNDPSVFTNNNGTGFSNDTIIGQSQVLSAPILQHLYLEAHLDKDNHLLVTLKSVDQAIDFSYYPTSSITLSLQNTHDVFFEPATLDSHCVAYYCDSVNAIFSLPPDGTYAIIASYYKESIAALPNAITIDQRINTPLLNPSFSSVTSSPTITPTKTATKHVLGISVTASQSPPVTTQLKKAISQPLQKRKRIVHTSQTFITKIFNTIYSFIYTFIHRI